MQSLEGIFNFGDVTIFDLLDLLIIWLIIYGLFRFMRGRRTMQMAVGLFALFLSRFLAEFFNLVVVSKIISSLLSIIPVAVIVLFQDEIRRLLASLGTTSFFGSAQKNDQGGLEHIFNAALTMSRNSIGGLIVMEREQSLQNYVEAGTRIDAVISPDLLIDIFNPKATLHDGAVIIAKERIASAACILPLTHRQSVPKHYGTRHRAAIGASEESDCIVLVISEETGRISLCQDGEIFTVKEHSLPKLIEFYHSLTIPDGEERTETLKQLKRKSARERKHGKVKKKEPVS